MPVDEAESMDSCRSTHVYKIKFSRPPARSFQVNYGLVAALKDSDSAFL